MPINQYYSGATGGTGTAVVTIPVGSLLPITNMSIGSGPPVANLWTLPASGGTNAIIFFFYTLASTGGEAVALVVNGTTVADIPSPAYAYKFGNGQGGRNNQCSGHCPVDLHGFALGSNVTFGLLNVGNVAINLVSNSTGGAAVKMGGAIFTN